MHDIAVSLVTLTRISGFCEVLSDHGGPRAKHLFEYLAFVIQIDAGLGDIVRLHHETLLEQLYRSLGKVETQGHAFLVSGIIASTCSLLSLAGTNFAFRNVDSPLLPVVVLMASLLPFCFVLASSFLLLRGFLHLDQRNKQLTLEVERDNLTRLANRSAFVRRGRDMLAQAGLQKSALSLILIDADHFKKINDNYGHLAGDLALQHLASILRQTSRDQDLVARWGGEEFAILLNSADLYGAHAYAERLVEMASDTPFFWEGEAIRLTMSAGVTEWQKHDDDLHRMIIRADEALYVAKSEGRNQVKLAAEKRQEVEGFKQDVDFCEVAA